MTVKPMPPIDIPGVTLTPSSLGGLQVEKDGRRIGWIHHRDNKVRAYLVDTGASGRAVGSYDTDELAIRAILRLGSPT